MQLRVYQWIVIIVFDAAMRAAYSIFSAFAIIGVFFALPLSLGHLTLLALINDVVKTFEPRARSAAAIVLVSTNTLFTLAYTFDWVASIKSGQQTYCVRNSCYWVDGAITSAGIQTIAEQAAIQIVINVIPVLLACALGPPCRKPKSGESTA
jgi:hypothetical protein